MTTEPKTITVDGVECVVVDLTYYSIHGRLRHLSTLNAVANFAQEMAPQGKSLLVCRLCPRGVTKTQATICTPCVADDACGSGAATLVPIDLYHILKLRLPS